MAGSRSPLALAAFCLYLAALAWTTEGLRYLGSIPVKRAGFSSLYEHADYKDPTERYSVLLSTFNPVPFTRDATFMYEYIGKSLKDLKNVQGRSLSNSLLWPREPQQISQSVFGFNAVCQPDGFLTPGKDDGSVNVIDLDGFRPVTHDLLAGHEDQTRWFYHRVTWKDMNRDGLLDAVTCRAHQKSAIFDTYDMEMVWLEHPSSSDVFGEPWKAHVMNKDLADTFSVPVELEAGGRTYGAIVTCGYFSEKLVIHWTEDPLERWTDPRQVKYHVIDVGSKFFDAEIHDVNNDGRLDLLVAINSVDNGSLVVYEIPDDFRMGEYKSHLIADGFYARSGLMGGGSPGSGSAFYPDTRKTSGKPWLLLSGDDMGTAYYYKPGSEDPSNWSYQEVVFVDEGPGTIVGKLTAADVDGDGNAEIFVPSYQKDLMHVYTFAP